MVKRKGNKMSKWTQALAEKGINCSEWSVQSFEKVPADVWEDLLYEINKLNIEHACNFRAYRWKDGLYSRSYKRAWSRGSYGEADWWTKSRSGDIWRIGCNF